MLYTFYGDDFTGSTDVLETLALAGIPTALFLTPPTPADLDHFPNLQALGIAGDSRSRTPAWMSANLPRIFQILQSFAAPIVHYKTCSTFDSAPHLGSIGRAIELGIQTLAPPFVPIVVGAPHLGRFVLFGTLFAAAGPDVYRIDRHPTMSRHPVTPMHEPDLRRHLAAQTDLPIALLDLRNLTPASLAAKLDQHPAAILFDTFDQPSLEATGRLLWQSAQQHPLFAAGSSGLTQSLIPAWRADHLIPASPSIPHAEPIDQMLVVSGSCSHVTQTQIEWALANGFHGIRLHPTTLLEDPTVFTAALQSAITAIQQGRSPILYTSLGPLAPQAVPQDDRLGATLGRLVRAVLEQTSISRVLLCGGDTSSHAIQQLPIRALTLAAPLTPGAPLCRAWAPGTQFHHTEFILKGGQMGAPDFFAHAMAN
jgi:uncharacterized protein YgbK (DUF1537 family)